MTELSVHHGTAEYSVRIGHGILGERGPFAVLADSPLLIVTDENVARCWLQPLRENLSGADMLVLPPGEEHKQLQTVERIWDRLAELNAGRDVVLIALGGGVIGDMTGFAAACWMRGVRFVQVPTTLLAQVDASVGGKTAVDHPAGKNLIGAFHQPEAVVIDTATLNTLPQREYNAGLAEVIKAALIADADFLSWLERNSTALVERVPQLVTQAIERSVAIKAEIVAADERERSQRALLNLGHTFGHAIEAASGFRGVLHGEAVAIGLLLAAALSEQLCGLDAALRPRLENLLSSCGLPTTLPVAVGVDQLLDAMRLDKKHLRDQWRLVLLTAPGHAELRTVDDRAAIRGVLQAAGNRP